MLIFLRREENRRTRRKTLGGAWAKTNNKLNPHMTPGAGPGIEPGTHWWEASSHHCATPAPHVTGL